MFLIFSLIGGEVWFVVAVVASTGFDAELVLEIRVTEVPLHVGTISIDDVSVWFRHNTDVSHAEFRAWRTSRGRSEAECAQGVLLRRTLYAVQRKRTRRRQKGDDDRQSKIWRQMTHLQTRKISFLINNNNRHLLKTIELRR